MSGRSAYVRKKITETKKGEGGPARQPQDEVAAISELPVPSYGPYGQDGTLSGNDSGHFQTFADARMDSNMASPTGSHERDSADGKRTEGNAARPLDDFAYARARKPTIKAEDMSGISKSGMRSAYDKRSEDIRKGLSKAFGFGNKKGKRETAERPLDTRPESASTVRPHYRKGDLMNEHNPIRYPHPPQIYELPAESSAGPPTMPPPTTTLPPLPLGSQVRRWIGTGRPVQRWNKLRRDPELWDPHGDVLIYLGPKGHNPRVEPSLRLSSHIIEATDSRYLITILREGAVEDLKSLPPSPPDAPEQDIASDLSTASPSDQASATADSQVEYEIYFPAPSHASKTDQLRHQLTTRNVFAILCHVSLVGLSLHQALSDLLTRLDQYIPQGQNDNVLTIMSYLSARGIDDVRNDAETAVGVLAWSEDPKVRWEEAWRETFVHTAGLYGTGHGKTLIESCTDFKNLSPITRALLERASLETQLRVQAAEERLASFSFGDMWPVSISMASSLSGAVLSSPTKDAADRLQRFFVHHYRAVFGGRWPPPAPSHGSPQDAKGNGADEAIWLTRTVAQALQKDFGGLYDYLVNRDIIWDMSETRSSRKWLMVSETGNKAFESDTVDLPMTDILIEFDNRQRFPHIPHPYPLVPESIPAQPYTPMTGSSLGSPVSASNTGSMNFLKRNRTNTESEISSTVSTHRSAAVERRVHLAYTESTNIYVLGSDFVQSDLIDAFVKFEKTDRVGEVDPSLARRARWVLIYGILQILASVSVDAPSVRYRDGVSYHLSPQLKGARIPPWTKKSKHTGASSHHYLEAAHELSHCWVAPITWTASNTSASEEDGLLDDPEDGTSRLPNPNSPVSLEQGNLGLAFPYPPPLTLSGRSQGSSAATRSAGTFGSRAPTTFSMSSDGAHSDAAMSAASTPTWLQTSSSQSTTRTTTPSTATLPPMSPGLSETSGGSKGLGRTRKTMSPPMMSSDTLSAQSAAPTPRSRRAGQLSPAGRARVGEMSGEWEPVRRAEMSYERARRDISSASEAGSAASAGSGSGARRTRRKKKAVGGEMQGLRGSGPADGALSPSRSPSPARHGRGHGRRHDDDLEEEEDAAEDAEKMELGLDALGLESGIRYERPLLAPSETSSMAPVIRDFDELDVDDIMP